MKQKATTTQANNAAPSQLNQASHEANLSSGEILINLALANAGGDDGLEAPEIIKLAPRGKTQTRDGRAYEFSPEVLVERFNNDKIDLAVDLEHSLSSFVGDKSQGAIGWIAKLEARADGLYGHVEWLEHGLKTLKARTHRYISPTFRHDPYGKATWLHSVALVASPALSNMPALATSDPNNNPEIKPMSGIKLIKLTAALGLTEDASEDAMLTALNTKLENQVDQATHNETLAKLSVAEDALQVIKDETRAAKLSAVFEDALKSKKMVPAEQGDFEKLAATDAGLSHVESILAARPAALAASGLDGQAAPNVGAEGEIDINPVQLAAKAQAHVAEMAAKNVQVPFDQAIEYVKQQKPAA